MFPLSGLRVVEMGSNIAVPYVSKVLVDGGAQVTKIESPSGDPMRRWSASGSAIPNGADGPMFQFLNAGKTSVVFDLDASAGDLESHIADAHLVLDDHRPADAARLNIRPADLRAMNPAAIVATLTPFGASGPWADRPTNEFVLQALVGATENRGIPGEEPISVGGQLGDFVAAAFMAPAVLSFALAAADSGVGAHVDCSQIEAMMLAFQTYRPIFDSFAPDMRPTRQIEIPSIEPAKDGMVGFCAMTAQQWQDFCHMVGAPEWADDPRLAKFHGRMEHRYEVWERIRAFTSEHTVDELVELATSFRIPAGPIGVGDKITSFDQFVDQKVFVENPHGFVQPRSPFQFSASELAPLRPAPTLAEAASTVESTLSPPVLRSSTDQPLAGIKVVDLSAFWAGPVATNLLRVLGADVIKVEGHTRLDGMRWASGLPIPMHEELWEWSPVYHGANAGKRVLAIDLSDERGLELTFDLISDADIVIENFSPRVTESWGLTWDAISAANDQTIFLRVPAYGTKGPWRDRVGFAMNMEQVSGLANRTGWSDGSPTVPRGPVDTLAGMHAATAAIMALADRERLGVGQLVEVPLIEGALQAAAEQVIEYSAFGEVLSRQGNQGPTAKVQGLAECIEPDTWLAVSCTTDDHLAALATIAGGNDLNALKSWAASRSATAAASALWRAGIPAGPCMHFNDTGRSPQDTFRSFLQWFEHPVTGWTPYPSYPWQVNGNHLDLGGPAPTLGQNNHDVLESLGRTASQITQLESDGIIGSWPAMIPKPS